jgi:hypothetical protein
MRSVWLLPPEEAGPVVGEKLLREVRRSKHHRLDGRQELRRGSFGKQRKQVVQ